MKLPPGPKGLPVFGSVFEPQGDSIRYLTKCAREYGDIVFFRFLGVPACFVNRPDCIESILVTQNNNFVKSKDYRAMRRVLGNGLLLSEGEFWRRQRKLIQPAFHQERIAAYGEIMVGYTVRMLADWSDGQELDIHEAMMRLTLGIVAKTLFDADVSHEAEDVDAALSVLMGKFLRQAGLALLLPSWVPLPTSQLLKRAVGRLDKVIYGIIEQRRASGQMSGDLLSVFLQLQDDEGVGMNDRQLHDEIMTLFLAGHETTANVLSWTWFLLGQNPEAEEKLHEELGRVLGGRVPTPADLPRLVYTDMALRESMRIYPPVWVIGRRALAPFRLGEYELPADTNVLISQLILHRDARYFPEPDRFDPDRWCVGDPRNASLPRFAYFPFGGGPRVCIGAAFGMMEAVLLLATIAQQFRIQIAPGQMVKMQPTVTLRPRNGIPVTLKRR
ncbi:MAG TPA: cytochrome P450 [Candidatus Acidoferrales bacterium]|nr:cytochrome P450 [Candidatus Acidoferrales bacterium]